MNRTVSDVRSDSNLRALLRSCVLVWQAAPGEIRHLSLLTLVSGAGPVILLYFGKVVIDAVASAARSGPVVAPLSRTIPELISTPAVLASVVGFVVLNIFLDAVETLEAFELGSLRDRVHGHARSLLYEKVASFDDVALFEDPERLNILQMAQQTIPRLQGLAVTVGNLLKGLFAFVPVFVLSFSITPWVPLVIFATAVPSIIAQAHYERRAWDVEFTQAPRYRRMDLQGRVLTGPEYAKELRLFGLQGLFLSRWRGLFWSAYEDVRRVRRRGAMVVVGLSLVSGLGTGLPYAYVVARAYAGALSLGDLALYAGLIFQIRRSLFFLVANATYLRDAALGSAAVYRLLDLRPTLQKKTGRRSGEGQRIERGKTPSPDGSRDTAGRGIRVDGVSFSYPGGKGRVLSDVTLAIGPGETVVVVGENGAGKTTLAKLLCRLYDPEGGRITWGGKDLRDFDLDELRGRIAVLNQDYARFPATAGENIAFGLLAHADDEAAVRRAAEEAGIAGAIEALPEGFETTVSKQMEGGIDLSGGQWQRIALARALMRGSESELLVLDEPTAALDSRAEHEILTTLRRMTARKMTLIISHRLALARYADQIAVMEDGRVVEAGTHRELMESGGPYSEMFARQAESYVD